MPPEIPFAALTSPADVAEAAHWLYGAPPPHDAGVVHPTSVWNPGDGLLRTLRITSETPTSAMDRFALDLARARADGILTTGKILREEPGLTLEYRSPPAVAGALATWRERVLGRHMAPVGVVLTRTGDLDLGHPCLHAGNPIVVMTTHAGAERLLSATLGTDLEVVSHDAPSATLAIDYLRRTWNAATVSVEAGPSTSRSLYAPEPFVDELLLTTFGGESLPAPTVGPPLLDVATIEALFPQAGPAVVADEPSGRWLFQRRLR